jgi:anthranilate/para-aminobenzoate synthase component II
MHGKLRLSTTTAIRYLAVSPGRSKLRNHSLIVDQQTFPDVLKVTATTEEGEIMALRHRKVPRRGCAVSSRIGTHPLWHANY